MFRNILGLWSGKGLLEKVLDDFSAMPKLAEEMYIKVMENFFNPNMTQEFKQSIYDMDQKINGLERLIRKRIVEHLAVSPTRSLNVSLILMSVIKDAERVGDLIKNLLEASRMIKHPFDRAEFEVYFNNLPEQISKYFSTTVNTFVEFDDAAGLQLIKEERATAKQCDRIIETLANSELGANRAVCFTIIARYLKRITLHLANIVTAVVVPLSDLDYFDERRIPDS